jgi:hypothetical protein
LFICPFDLRCTSRIDAFTSPAFGTRVGKGLDTIVSFFGSALPIGSDLALGNGLEFTVSIVDNASRASTDPPRGKRLCFVEEKTHFEQHPIATRATARKNLAAPFFIRRTPANGTHTTPRFSIPSCPGKHEGKPYYYYNLAHEKS